MTDRNDRSIDLCSHQFTPPPPFFAELPKYLQGFNSSNMKIMAEDSKPTTTIFDFLKTLVQWNTIVLALAFGGLTVSVFIESQSLARSSPQACDTGAYEIDQVLKYSRASLLLTLSSMLLVTWAKEEARSLFGAEVDAMMRTRTSKASLVAVAIFFGILSFAGGLSSFLLAVFYISQLKSQRYECMDNGEQAAWMAVIFGLPLLFLLGNCRIASRNFSPLKAGNAGNATHCNDSHDAV